MKFSSSCSSAYGLMWLLGLVVLQALAFQFQISLCSVCLEQERTALLQIKASMSDYSIQIFKFPESWDSGSSDCCGWDGVECDITTGKVIKLLLSAVSLGWPLNTSVFLPFEDLAHLDLSGNGITSWVPNQGLERLSALSKLHVLILDFNRFDDKILPSLGQLSSLRTLSLSDNRLEGSFDFGGLGPLHALDKLEVLDLSWNYLNNNITILQSVEAFPASNGSSMYSNLLELDLSENDLGGTIPSWLGNFTSLQSLDLSHDQFEGNLALSPVADLNTLECLIISDNNLEIPFSLTPFFNHSKLKVLIADSNRLLNDKVEFHHPSFITPKFQLRVLSFSHCWSNKPITGLPNFFRHQTDLRLIDLSNINLALPFPSWFVENNSLLEQCNLRSNSLTGTFLIPSDRLFPQMTALDLSDNSLEGQALETIGRVFPRLEILIMSNNYLSGKIPTIDDPSLRLLRLSHNRLSGQLSPSIFNLTSLEYLDLDDNHFVGEIPDISPHFSLTDLDLSNNHISGNLPRWIGNMSGLTTLALASNHLEGSIPAAFCNLGDSFEFLDLSNNDLSGSIPSCFNPPSIKHVHLKRNKLSGPMTSAFRNSPSLVTLDLINNKLAGSIPSWIGELSSLSFLLLKLNNFDGVIPLQLCNLKSLTILDLSQNNLSGRLPLCLANMHFQVWRERRIATPV